jgi:hypothetical protein
MDWTPTGPTEIKQINPKRVVQPTFQSPYRHVGPSPFRGTLPPAPQAPAHKARNPRSLQPFIPASKEKQELFAKKLAGDNDDVFGGASKRGDYILQQPKMRDRDAESRETGLESLFNAAFSVSGPPQEISAPQSQEEYEGFVPGIESSPPSSQKMLPTKMKQDAQGRMNDGAGAREMARFLVLAIVVLGVGLAVRQGWGQWSDVGSFIWKVLSGSGTEASGGETYFQEEPGEEMYI